jgi:hypothetical protein
MTLREPDAVDRAQAAMAELPPAEIPVVHHHTPGLYIREMHGPMGAMVVTMRHKTEHPFVLLKGRVRLISETEGEVIYQAPYLGITKPGTRRVAYFEEDSVWVTFHPTEETDVEKIAAQILEPNDNPFLPADSPHLNHWRLQSPPPVLP